MRTPTWVRAALSHPCFTGIPQQHLGALIAELADPWTAQHEAALTQRRGHGRRPATGAGPKPRLVFCDRVLVTLVVLRFQLPHQALAVLYGIDRATVTRAVGEVRPLLAARGFAVPGQPGVRLRTLADVFAYAAACGVEVRIDATETQVRRPRAHRVGRRAFVSSKRKQNTIKTTTCSDHAGRTLWSGAVRPGRMHDQTAVKTEGIAALLGQHPTVKVSVDEGYRGLATAFPDQVHAPPRKPPKDTPAEAVAVYEQVRHRQSSRRICVEHAIAEHKQWRSLQRWIGRREYYGETYLAVAGLVSDRAARRGAPSAGTVRPARPDPNRTPSRYTPGAMVDDETDAVLAAWDRTTSRLADEIRGMRDAVERLTLERAVRRPAEPESPEEHRLLYRARQIPGFIDGYRAEYDRNKWWADAFQNSVIVGSVLVTLTSSAAGFVDRLRWVAASASGVVAIAAGLAAHYKFRERAANAHRTADAIEHEKDAADLGIGRYRERSSKDVLAMLVEEVERLREEQRQREQQLEQRPEPRPEEGATSGS